MSHLPASTPLHEQPTGTGSLPQISLADRISQIAQAFQDSVLDQRRAIARALQHMLHSLGTVDPKSDAEGKAIQKTINHLLLTNGLRLEIERDGTRYPGTLYFQVGALKRSNSPMQLSGSFFVNGTLPDRQFRISVQNDFAQLKVTTDVGLE